MVCALTGVVPNCRAPTTAILIEDFLKIPAGKIAKIPVKVFSQDAIQGIYNGMFEIIGHTVCENCVCPHQFLHALSSLEIFNTDDVNENE